MNAPDIEPETEAATTRVVAAPAPPPPFRHDEILRTRNFAAGTFIVASMGMVGQWVNAITGWPGIAARVLLALVTLQAGILWYRTAVRKHYSPAQLLVFGATSVFCSTAIELDVGLFSPIIAMNVLGFPFFARTRSTVLVWTISSLKIAAYATLALLITFDVMPDLGHFSSAGVPRSDKLALTIVVIGMMLMALAHGRLSRRSAIESLALERTLARGAHEQAAQLAEAKVDLEVALRAQRGQDGRYSGDVVDGWKVGALIGRGAMGEVYAARDDAGREAAIKFLVATPGIDDPARVARFLREAKVASSLHSTNLVQVLAVGESAEGIPYLAMELLDGEDLASRLRRDGRLSLAETVAMTTELARGLRVAHDAGIVHRDLKPGNIFACSNEQRPGRWKVLDFGVCTEAGSTGTLTADGLVGTPQYMAPEQALGDAVGPAADLFGFGAVIYRVLTGSPPFSGPGAPQLLYSIVHDFPVGPRELAPALPVDVERFFAIALAKRKDDRFASAVAMAEALAGAAKNALDPDLRARADRLLAKHPWRPLPKA